MNNNRKVPAFRLLMVIATPKLVEKASNLFKKGALPIQFRFKAEGTASSDILDMLGLGSVEKNVLLGMMPKKFADIMLNKLQYELQLNTANSGIAFTIPITGANSMMLCMLTQETDKVSSKTEGRENIMSNETKNVLIAAIINRGFSGDVMEAAKKAGASGGTVLHSRQIGNTEVNEFWGITVHDEKEIVLIIADVDNKVKIMQMINENCGMNSNAKGMVVALPIDSVVGIQRKEE